MSSAGNYLKNIYQTIVSILDGMSITFSYLLQKPVTIQYPNRLDGPVQKRVADRFRGLLQVDYDLCTSCMACAKACPIDCITLDGVKVPGHKGKAPYFFYIDLAKCMYCGLCVEPCPTDAIFFTREFEGSVSHVENLVYSYVPEEVARRFIYENAKAEREKERETARAKEEKENAGESRSADASEAKEGGDPPAERDDSQEKE